MQIHNNEILNNWQYQYKNNTWKLNGKGKCHVFKKCMECDEYFFGLPIHKFCCRSHGSSYNNRGRRLSDETKNKIRKKCLERDAWSGEKNPMYGKGYVVVGERNPNWKGGCFKKGIPLYDTYYKQLLLYDKVRRSKKDLNTIETKCAYCGKWFIPALSEVCYRLSAIKGQRKGYSEHRLYCSNECKFLCPIFNKQKWPKGFKISTSREVQPELRQLVFERDNWTCVKCKSTENLHCHHIEGIRWEPIESADMDKCITICKYCHTNIHKKNGCKYNEMRCS